jgi:hypothetical protein
MSASSGARSAGRSPSLDIQTLTTSGQSSTVALSSQKNYCVLYLFGPSESASQLAELKAAFKAAGKKLNMGKCCVNFQSPEDLPLKAIGKLISEISSEEWIEFYEQSRLKTKAGLAKKTKQGALSPSKGAAK